MWLNYWYFFHINVEPSWLTARTSNSALSLIVSIPGTLLPAGIPATVIPLMSGFSNKSFVFTGTLTTLSRDEAKYRAKTKGAKILSNVSTNTDYVIVGEKSGSKAEKAKNLGIKILNEKDYLKKISE